MGKSGSYILAIDSGTTSVRSILIDRAGQPVAVAQEPLDQFYPQPGWVEHDAAQIWQRQRSTIADVIAKAGIDAGQVAAVGITNQRETVVVWDRVTGEPIHRAIVWQCRRTAQRVADLKAQGLQGLIARKTGLVLDPYFSGTKVAWILDNVPGARERAEAGELLAGTIDAWLIWNLTRGAVHATDYTNASRTMLCDIQELTWDGELGRILGVPMGMLPAIKPSVADYGCVDGGIIASCPPIRGVAGDQQASLFGHCCWEAGDVKATFGTGCFMLMHTGAQVPVSGHGLISTVAASADGAPAYALEGSVFNAGTVIQWLRDELGLIATAEESEVLARSVPDSGGVHLVPAFTGLGAPWWDADARGALLGVTRGTNRAHVARAALESEVLQAFDVLDAMGADARVRPQHLAVDGGGSMNGFLMGYLADLTGCVVERPEVAETTALGAAFLAGLGCGFWDDLAQVRACRGIDARYEPVMDAFERREAVDAWHAALKRVLS